ncbi:MAG: lysophospholipid acyltransferase family protein, partial [Planctomycetota bacterium]
RTLIRMGQSFGLSWASIVRKIVSHFDPPLVGCWLPRGARFVARETLFRGPFGRLIAFLGAIPVRRGEPDTAAIRRYVAELHAGHVLLMFPEGTRGADGPTGAFLRGASLLIKRAKVDVVPVGIDGPARALPRGSRPSFPPPRLAVCYGEKIRHADLAALPPDEALATLQNAVEHLRLRARGTIVPADATPRSAL